VTWRAKVFFEGRVIAQRSFGRRVGAKRWEADQLAKLDAGSWIDPTRGRITFAALAEEWQAPRGYLAVRSQETTRFLLDKYVIPEMGAFPISGISAADVERAMSALTARGLATATRRRALSMIRLVFDYAIRDRRLSVNVARMVALPRGGTKREPHWLRPEQLGRLVMAVPPLCQPVVLFLGTTGCRFSEMAALRVDDVVQTPHGLGVRVHRAATQSKRTSGAVFGPTKTHQTRTVPVPAALDGYVRAGRRDGRRPVHDLSSTKGCLPEPTNRIDLGYFASCTGAVAAAKTYYSDVNGCYWCARDCHTT
jgi:integrase